MPVTQNGDPIQAGDKERRLRFTGLNYDWAAAGRTVKLRLRPPSGASIPDITLVAATEGAEQASLDDINGILSEQGKYDVQLRLYQGSTFIRASLATTLMIHKVI